MGLKMFIHVKVCMVSNTDKLESKCSYFLLSCLHASSYSYSPPAECRDPALSQRPVLREENRPESTLEQDAERCAISGQIVLAGVYSRAPVFSDDAFLVRQVCSGVADEVCLGFLIEHHGQEQIKVLAVLIRPE